MLQPTDAFLVDQSIAGDRQAFAEIVRRYQNLLCSVAYGATGKLNVSEELAQEAFVAAWKSLKSLQDASKLRPWLCGIVRNLARSSVRATSRDVLADAGEIMLDHVANEANDPVQSTIAREETALLDKTLSQLPETYREPLVLFYREEQSVKRVAELLDISPTAVKQRLARGREMLRNEVAAIVERGLSQSAPKAAFTLGVLAALPVMTNSAKAATLTVTSAKGVSAMHAAGMAGTMGMILGPLAGLLGSWFGYSMSLRTARSDRERDLIRWGGRAFLILIFVLTLVSVVYIRWGTTWVAQQPTRYVAGLLAMTLIYIASIAGLSLRISRGVARIRREDGTDKMDPSEVAAKVPAYFRTFQYSRSFNSKATLLGIPLVSIQYPGPESTAANPMKPAIGWIAIGHRAYGILFATGTFAVGGIAFGAIGLGLVSIGGLALGGIALGGVGLGCFASGGLSMGWMAFGGIAVAWKAAIGGVAIAHEFALGGFVVGQHANDELAKTVVLNGGFYRAAGWLLKPWGWWALVVAGLAPQWIAFRLVKPEADQ